MLKIGLIGYGEIGEAHRIAIEQTKAAELVAIAEPNEQRRNAAAKSGVRTYESYEELLNDGAVDAVVVATPDHLHTEPCIAAAEAKKHILVEKPIATSVADAERILQAANSSGVKLMVGHTLRFFPEYQHAKQAVQEQELGKVISLFARRTNIAAQQSRLQGRCGVLLFLGVHDFDVLRWICDAEPRRIYCESATSIETPYAVESETFTTIQFDNGAIGCVHAGWWLPDNHPAGFEFKLDVTGDKGILNLDFSNHQLTKYTVASNMHMLFTDAMTNEIRSFAACIASDTDSPVSGNDGIVALKMALAAEQSFSESVPIDLAEVS